LTTSSSKSGWPPSKSGVTAISITRGTLAPPAPSLTCTLTVRVAAGLDARLA
jgi:hypothetical protein